MDIRTASGIQANRPAPASAVPTAPSAADARAPERPTSQAAGQSASAASPSDPVVVAGGYISPVLRYDQGARLAVIHFRDRSSGETQNQIPAPQVVEEYRRTASRLGVRTDAAPPGGAGRSGTSGVGAGTASGAPPTGMPSMGTPSKAPAATGSPLAGGGTTGVGMAGAGVTAAAPASGSYGAGSPGAIVSVTV